MIYPLILAVFITLCSALPAKNQHPPTMAVLPSELREMKVVSPNTKLANMDLKSPSTFINITPEHASMMQLSDDDKEAMKWITNGTHVMAFAQYVYDVDAVIAGTVVSELHIDFRNRAKYDGAGASLVVGILGAGWGTCWLTYGVEWIAERNWGARFTMNFFFNNGDTRMDFTANNGDILGYCIILIHGRTTALGACYGQFHV